MERFWSISPDHIWRFSISLDGITEATLEGRALLDGQFDCDARMARPDDDDYIDDEPGCWYAPSYDDCRIICDIISVF